MPKTNTILELFVASPSDVEEERRVLQDVIKEINVSIGSKLGVGIELIMWETHTRPGFGSDPQDVINRQIGDKYDIFLGIMWGRFGSPTSKSDSGTEEEFNNALKRFHNDSSSIQLLFYFKDAGIAPSRIDIAQLSKVQEFKTKISTEHGGLYHTFESPEDFQTKVRIHLSGLLHDWVESKATAIKALSSANTTPLPDRSSSLAHLLSIENDLDEEGIIDFVEQGTEAINQVTETVSRMTVALNELGAKATQREQEAKQFTNSSSRDFRALKRIVNNAGEDFESFVRRMSVEIPEFSRQNAIAMDNFSKVALNYDSNYAFDQAEVNSLSDALSQFRAYRSEMEATSGKLTHVRKSFERLPKMTSTYNRARKRSIAIMDDLLTQLKIAASQAEAVEQLLEVLVKKLQNDLDSP